MKSLKPRNELHTRIAQVFQHAATLQVKANASSSEDPDLPGSVIRWLAQLSLFYGVPFSYLVPDPRMLPPESLRFFYVDRNWIDRLIDGAMSIGIGSTADDVFNETFFEAVYSEVANIQAQLRANLRVKAVSAGTPSGGPLAGLLFRSVVVSTWPGLEVQGMDPSGNLLPILRMDRLSSNVLVVIFNGIPATVNVIEPSEGLHMEVQTGGGAGNTATVYLRGLGIGGYPAGTQIESSGNPVTASGQMRSGTFGGVVNVGSLVSGIQTAMPSGALADGMLTPGGFALQTVKVAGLQAYKAGANPCAIT